MAVFTFLLLQVAQPFDLPATPTIVREAACLDLRWAKRSISPSTQAAALRSTSSLRHHRYPTSVAKTGEGVKGVMTKGIAARNMAAGLGKASAVVRVGRQSFGRGQRKRCLLRRPSAQYRHVEDRWVGCPGEDISGDCSSFHENARLRAYIRPGTAETLADDRGGRYQRAVV